MKFGAQHGQSGKKKKEGDGEKWGVKKENKTN